MKDPSGSGKGEPSTADNPWATDVPVRPVAPLNNAWKSRGQPSNPAPVEPVGWVPAAAQLGPVGLLADDPDDEQLGSQRKRHRQRTAAIAVVCAIAAVAAVAVMTRPDDSGRDSRGESEIEPTEASVPDTLDDPADDGGSATTTPSLPGIGDEASGGESDESSATSTWQVSRLNLPFAARAIREPTEIVGLSADGILHSIDLPSGIVRSLDLYISPESQVVLGESMIAVAVRSLESDRHVLLIAPGRIPLDVEFPDSVAQVVARPGTDDFRVILNQIDANFPISYMLHGDGTFDRLANPVDSEFDPWSLTYSPSGDAMVIEDGGVYRVAGEPPTTTRLTTGRVVGAGARHLLVRECDESMTCGFVLIDDETGERVSIGDDVLSDESVLGGYGEPAQLTPDGSAVLIHDYRNDPMRVSVHDLATGESISIESHSGSWQNTVWTADGSGVIVAGGETLSFIDRATGLSHELTNDLGRLNVISGRPVRDRATAAYDPSVTSGLRVLGFGSSGDIFDIEVDTGSVVRFETPAIASGAPVYLVPDGGELVAASFDNVPGFRIDLTTGAVEEPGSSELSGPVYPGPSLGSVWRAADSEGGFADSEAFELVDSSGVPTGPIIDLQTAEVVGSDGRGGLVLGGPGGTYVATGDGVKRLTTGELIAIGPTAAFVRECDGGDQLECVIVRIDRADDARTPIVDDAMLGATADSGSIGLTGSTVSPDGEVAAIHSSALGGGWFMVDTAAPTVLDIAGVGGASPMIWSADSQSAVYLSGDHLWLYDRAGRSMTDLTNLIEMPRLTTIVNG